MPTHGIKILKIVVVCVIIILFIDCLISTFAIEIFLSRTVVENDINNAQNIERYLKTYDYFFNDETRRKIVNKYFNEYKMVLIYPNLKLQLNDGKQLYVQDFYKYVKPYYYKFKKNLIDIKL